MCGCRFKLLVVADVFCCFFVLMLQRLLMLGCRFTLLVVADVAVGC